MPRVPRAQGKTRALRRLVYLIVPLGVLHFWWTVKRDLTQPAIFAAILALLLAHRLVARIRAAGRPRLEVDQTSDCARVDHADEAKMRPEYR